MEIIIAQPPNIEAIRATFDIKDKKGIVYTFGHYIFNPDDGELDEPLMFHEATHSLQQDDAGSPEAWWDRYLKDPKFRLNQEVEAYQNQYRRMCELVKDKNKQAVYLHTIALDLSSKQYGNIIGLVEARRVIRRLDTAAGV